LAKTYGVIPPDASTPKGWTISMHAGTPDVHAAASAAPAGGTASASAATPPNSVAPDRRMDRRNEAGLTGSRPG
jgi:hypothetical protein